MKIKINKSFNGTSSTDECWWENPMCTTNTLDKSCLELANEQVADQRTVQSPYPRVTEKEKQNQKVHTI